MSQKHDAETWTGEWDSAAETIAAPRAPLDLEPIRQALSAARYNDGRSIWCDTEVAIDALLAEVEALRADVQCERRLRAEDAAKRLDTAAALAFLSAPETACPVCGNEERHARTGLLTCECPDVRASLSASPSSQDDFGQHLRVLLELDGSHETPFRVAAFLRHYAAIIRRNERWDIPETMARAYESAAHALERYEQRRASLSASRGEPLHETIAPYLENPMLVLTDPPRLAPPARNEDSQ